MIGRVVGGVVKLAVAVALAGAIYWLVVVHGQGGEARPLAKTLSTIGEQFFAVIRNPDVRSGLQKAFSDFLTRAEAREIDPEQVETVAMVMLNAATADSVVSAEQLTGLLQAPVAPVDVPVPADSILRIRKRRIQEVTARLDKLVALHGKLESFGRRDPVFARELRASMEYQLDQNIKIALDPGLLEDLPRKERRDVEKACRDLEQERILIWQRGGVERPLPPRPIRVGHDSLRIDIQMSWEETSGLHPDRIKAGPLRIAKLNILREGFHAEGDSVRPAHRKEFRQGLGPPPPPPPRQ